MTPQLHISIILSCSQNQLWCPIVSADNVWCVHFGLACIIDLAGTYITDSHLAILEQHVFRLDIPMNNIFDVHEILRIDVSFRLRIPNAI